MNLLVLPPARPATVPLARLGLAAAGFATALAGAELVVRAVGPLPGALVYALLLVGTVNLTVLARLRDTTAVGLPWRLLGVAAVVPLERLLVLCMPPLLWDPVRVDVLWSIPLLVLAVVARRSTLLAYLDATGAPQAAPQPAPGPASEPPAGPVLAPGGGRRFPAVAGPALITLVGGGLGVAAALLAGPPVRSLGEVLDLSGPSLLGVVAVALAGCVQELLYRAVVQPVAAAAAGWAGVLATSALVAFGWVAWLGGVVAVPAAVGSLVFGWSVRRRWTLLGAVAGHGLFNLALALLLPQVLR